MGIFKKQSYQSTVLSSPIVLVAPLMISYLLAAGGRVFKISIYNIRYRLTSVSGDLS